MTKRLFLALLVTVAMFLVSGCTGGKMLQTLPSQNELSGIKGWSSAAVERKFGPEYTETFDSNGNKTWTYKKKFASNGWMTLGVPVLVDVVTIEFRNDKVISYLYNPGVLNGGLPGMSSLSSALGTTGTPKTLPDTPTKDVPEPSTTTKVMGLSKTMTNWFSSDTSPSENTAKTKDENRPTTSSGINSTFRHANLFTSCSLKDAKTRLCKNAKKLGLSAELKKDGRVVITSPQGTKVVTSFKPVGKDVVVELSATGPSDLSQDLCRAVEKCN